MRSSLRIVALVPLCVLTPAAVFAEGGEGHGAVQLWMSTPFLLLLLAIAVVPFLSKHWWERNYPFVATTLGAVVVLLYLLHLRDIERPLHTAYEYVSFISLIGSLFVVASGILIRIKGRSEPLANVVLLAIGGVIANVIGTTGASMILIRPYLRANKYRIKPYHVVFFIFIVSNIGGALTPIGDPPLFLGYLKGIPFFWVAEQVWLPWVLAMTGVLGIFYGVDTISFRRLPKRLQHEVEVEREEGEVSGLQNVLYLVVILIAVFITHPPFLREVLMIGAAVASYKTTRPEVHRKNEFNFIPIKEVAILFLGIFATMMPALDWLEHNAQSIGIQTPGQFYWATGTLSSFLDNAPTYLTFLSAQIGLLVPPDAVVQVQQLLQDQAANVLQALGSSPDPVRKTVLVLLRYHFDLVASRSVPLYDITTAYLLANHALYVQAISLAAVFFGSCTYIGNGPNFMVKSIAEQAGVQCPSFFGYIVRYTIPILLPIFFVIWLLFFLA